MKRLLLFIVTLLTAFSMSAKVTLNVVNETGQTFGKIFVYTENENGRHVYKLPSQTIDTLKYSSNLVFDSPKKVTLKFRTRNNKTDYICFGVDLSKVKTLKLNDLTTIQSPNTNVAYLSSSKDKYYYFRFENETDYTIYAIWPILPSNDQLENALNDDPKFRLRPKDHRIIRVFNQYQASSSFDDNDPITLKFAATKPNGELILFEIQNIDLDEETVIISQQIIKMHGDHQSSDPERIEDADNSIFTFNYDKNKKIAAVNGLIKNVKPSLINIPAKVKKDDDIYDVVEISRFAFRENQSIKKVRMPNSIRNIGWSSFLNCNKLEDIQIGDSVKNIGFHAFADCPKIKKVIFPNTQLKLDGEAFSGCTGVTYVYVPSSMDTLNTQVFSSFSNLEKLIIDKENKHLILEDSIVYSNDMKRVLYCLPNRTKDVNIPNGVEEIGYGAFARCEQLRKINIPKSVNKIASCAFTSCINVDTFIIPEGVKVIEDGTFARCLKTRCIQLPSTITKIGIGAFLKCEEVDTFIIPNGVTEIGEEAFRKCFSVDEIVLPPSLKKIGRRAFSMNSIRRITIPDSVTELPEDGLFDYSGGLEYVKLSNNLTVIPKHTFYNCKNLKEIIIPESVKVIDYGSFSGCKSLKTIHIPANVDSIDKYVFLGCNTLENISVDKRNKHYSSVDGILFNLDKTALIYYPLQKKDSVYKIPNGVKCIYEGAFSDNKYLKTIVIPKSVVDFNGGSNFDNCVNLRRVVLPSNMTIVPYRIFMNCKNLSDIKLPSKLEVISKYAFQSCPLKESKLKLPKTLKRIEYNAFAENPVLESVVIPQSIEEIDKYAFDKCDNLKTILSPKTFKGKYNVNSKCQIIEY